MNPQKRSNTVKFGLIIAIILAIGVGIQFTTPNISHPPITGTSFAPEAVMKIYKRACYDCHSNETNLTWYDKLAPASWFVAKDVTEGRSRFNFSAWDQLSSADQQGILWETVNELIAKKMPLQRYAFMHPDARISAADIEVLKNYVNTLPNNKPATAEATSAAIYTAAQQLRDLRGDAGSATDNIPVALNGVKYINSYRHWQIITTPNRFDNNTIRVLYGNDIAAKAIKENKIDHFPDGATVVKVVWNKIEDKEGNVRPGSLNSVQIMTKDDSRFPQTGGWGFALFAGIKLMPTGKTANFAIACYNCHHELASETGYIFDVPPPPAREMFDAGGLEVIAPSMNKSQGTVSILYGNAAARQATLDSSGRHKPGEIYTLATWEQVNDPHWYGSHLNGRLKSVETVSVVRAQDGSTSIDYQLVQGTLPKDPSRLTVDEQDRIALILNQQPAVFP